VTKFRTEVARLETEFRERVRRRPHDEARAVQEVDKICVVVDAIENEIVLFRSLAVCDEIAGPAAARPTRICRSGHRSCRELSDIDPVAPIERRVVDRFRIDRLADRAGFRLQQGCVRCHGDCLRNRTGGERQINFEALLRIHMQILASEGLKAVHCNRNRIVADLDGRKRVIAALVGFCLERETGVRRC